MRACRRHKLRVKPGAVLPHAEPCGYVPWHCPFYVRRSALWAHVPGSGAALQGTGGWGGGALQFNPYIFFTIAFLFLFISGAGTARWHRLVPEGLQQLLSSAFKQRAVSDSEGRTGVSTIFIFSPLSRCSALARLKLPALSAPRGSGLWNRGSASAVNGLLDTR